MDSNATLIHHNQLSKMNLMWSEKDGTEFDPNYRHNLFVWSDFLNSSGTEQKKSGRITLMGESTSKRYKFLLNWFIK